MGLPPTAVCSIILCTILPGPAPAAQRQAAAAPSRFTVVQPELFGEGGALTDAWADIDGDGDPDRFVGFNDARSRLYRNDREGGFVEVSGETGLIVTRSVRTAAWGDFDRDGDADLLLGFAGDAPTTALFENQGGSRFIDVAARVGLELSEGASRQASWIDYDDDGDLDLFLALRDRPNRLFRNDNATAFVDVSVEAGLGDTRRTVGALWLDADQDGDLDLLVANMNGDANGFWRNDAGRFTDAAAGQPLAAGGRALGDPSEGSVRVCAADPNVDGWFDLFFANYGPNALLYASAPGVWAPSRVAGVATDSRDDTCAWGDVDLDGLLDLYVNGTVTGGVQYPDRLYRGGPGGALTEATPPALERLNASHGATWVDVDLDGDLDLALAGAAADGMHYLMENHLAPASRRGALSVRVLDAEGHATRPGAEVRVFAAGGDRLLGLRLVDSGSGYDAQSDLPVHFGLAAVGLVDVQVTLAGSGERRTDTLTQVDPAALEGAVLEVRIDHAGRIVSPSRP